MVPARHTGPLKSLQANLPGGETSVLQSCQILLGMDPGNLASLMDDGVGIYGPTYGILVFTLTLMLIFLE